MDESLNERINKLREKSRFFLTQVDKNSKKVKEEIKKLYSQNLIPNENYKNYTDEPISCYRNNIKSWKLRNDSRGVAGVLCSDYFCNSPNQVPASMPNIPTVKRVIISSKKHSENQSCSEHINRKPVKECYCNSDIKSIQLRSGRTQHKQTPSCKRSKSHSNFNAVTVEDNEKSPLTSPISCETLRRVQKIDYAPRSQFLRNVQSKVSLLQAAAAKGDCPEMCYRSRCYHQLMARKNIHNVDTTHQSKNDDKSSETSSYLRKSESLSKVPITSETNKTNKPENVDKGIQVSLKKQSKPKVVIKRTLSSKKSVPDLKKPKSNIKISTKGKSRECPCSHIDKSEYFKNPLRKDNHVNSEDYQHTVCTNKVHQETDKEYLSEEEVRELRKFREQNYFDTHGSNHTLLSPKSSGSLIQHFLNDRLFPEPARRIHKKDLVVTMPACATVQRKRMHYFPRYVVRQEKNNYNTNYKKKRYQTCPLTGHAIDLGITKIRPPLNSLALKYQKRLP